jgi:predicted Na+-dependent transporter
MKFFVVAKKILIENQITAILLAFIVGIAFPTVFRPINEYSTQLLILVFFFSSLRLELSEIFDYAKDWRMLAIVSAYTLIILPFALFLPMLPFSYEWAVALLILGATPTGMTIALMAEFFGGKTSLALVITTVASLLAPFTIPIVTKIAVGEAVPIPMLQMFWSLFLTIVAPFALAMLVKRAVPKRVKKYDDTWRNISVLAFALLIAGIVANTQGGSPIRIEGYDVLMMLFSAALFAVLIWSSYYIVRWRTPSERITIALCMLYLNNTLALFVGDKFFSELGVVPKQIMLLMVVNAMLPFLKITAGKIIRPKQKITFKSLLT